MNQNILTLGQINEALHFVSVNAVQLADLGFKPLDNKTICEGLPLELARPLRTARIYPASDLPLICTALLERISRHAAPASIEPRPATASARYPANYTEALPQRKVA